VLSASSAFTPALRMMPIQRFKRFETASETDVNFIAE
jgi:hypothetical protein